MHVIRELPRIVIQKECMGREVGWREGGQTFDLALGTDHEYSGISGYILHALNR